MTALLAASGCLKISMNDCAMVRLVFLQQLLSNPVGRITTGVVNERFSYVLGIRIRKLQTNIIIT